MKRSSLYIITIIFLVTTLFFGTGCKKLVDVDSPITATSDQTVFNSDVTAAAVLTGVYTSMVNVSRVTGGLTSISFLTGLSSDEFLLYSGANNPIYTAYSTNALSSSNTSGIDVWIQTYPILYNINAAIEGISASKSLTPAVKQQLLGEAYFMRAFCYFYLVNLYGDVPLAVTTDYKTNSLMARTASTKVYAQIESDLNTAIPLLNKNYVNADAITVTTERVRPTQWAAQALLARVYLFLKRYADAENTSDLVLSNKSLFDTVSVNSVFLKNNQEAIWQLQPVLAGRNSQEANWFIIPSQGPGSTNPVILSGSLLADFEKGDLRRSQWIDSVMTTGIYYYPAKYKANVVGSPVTEYTTVLRLGEQYLIRAEARFGQGDLTGATSDLNVIRGRAGLSPITLSATNGMVLILEERRKELFSEWGNRWLDLKRTGIIDSVMSIATPLKGGIWNSNKQLYPITLTELQANPNLVQNTNY